MPRVDRPAVWRWRRRFAEAGVEGLLRDATRKPGKAPLGGQTVRRVVSHLVELSGEELDDLPRQFRHAPILLHARQEAWHVPGPLGLDEPELGQVPAHGVDQLVRCRTSSSHARCIINADCCCSVLTGTTRMDGRVTASQIAAASAASFLPRFT
jgi:hypothetical protein